MLLKDIIQDDLRKLKGHKDDICISLLFSTHRTSPERRIDRLHIKKMIDRVKASLSSAYHPRKLNPVFRNLDELFRETDFVHNAEGLGFFASSGLHMMVQFPFTIHEKVVIGNHFEIRDLLYYQQFGKGYFVLSLAEKGAQLYNGSWDELEQVKDQFFPMTYEDEYEYNKPVRSTSGAGHAHVKMFEKDKPALEDTRLKSFLRKVDNVLDNYLTPDTPLVVCGAGKDISLFLDQTDHAANHAGSIHGNFFHASEKDLALLAWPRIFSHLQKQSEHLAREFREKIGERRAVTGIKQIWKAAGEGKAFKLLVEKDYTVNGFYVRNTDTLYLRPPKQQYDYLPDAVNELINMVIEKNGQVIFTENGTLKEFDKIALITRY